MPHVQTTGEYAEVVHSSVGFLEGVLGQPSRTSFQEMEQFVWLPWNHRFEINGAGSLARLIWAAMGAVLLAQSDKPTTGEVPELIFSDDGPRTGAEKLVLDQCATAIQMLGGGDTQIPKEVAAKFTKTVCHTTPLLIGTTIRRLKWEWEDLVFEVAVLEDTDEKFQLEYIDRQGDEPLYSGPFSTIKEVDERLDLLRNLPITFRLERIV